MQGWIVIYFKIRVHLEFGLAKEAQLELLCNIECWAKEIYKVQSVAYLGGYF